MLLFGVLACLAISGRAAEPVDFNRDIRHILSENCYHCHGPDEAERKGGSKGARLRLDTAEGALADLGGYQAIAPGHPEKSDALKRIHATDPDEQMPPPKTGKKVSASDAALLARWIKEGAGYAKHWSYTVPTRPALPKVRKAAWPKNEIDYFILARLEKEKLKPSREADRATIIRRVALDLTGLPPTPAEVAAFAGDKSKNAYERMVDGLLARESFGEHWAKNWLDQARYADSAGYADDPARTIWAYRDYVIRALNANKPFDQFTIEQIAGDLLPEPTEEQLIATGFHRNTMTNNEGGTSDEEFRNVAVVDRVNTTMSVWMGTTMACAQCHTHKYDPIPQDDYFRLFAILNNTEDNDRTDEAPIFTLWTKEQKAERAALEPEISRLGKKAAAWTPDLRVAFTSWLVGIPADLNLAPFKTKVAAAKDEGLSVSWLGVRPSETVKRLEEFYLATAPALAETRARLAQAKSRFAEIKPVTTTPVLRELAGDKRRKTHLQIRGNYLNLGHELEPGLPSAFNPPSAKNPDRLALAKWLVDPQNPLTARVMANRYWETIFGIGLVRTGEDFGLQGDLPTHPELLDWLATEFMRSGWDTKHLLKLMVMSAAYRQSSRVTPEGLARDPENRLLARGPRFRLGAETIRDQALFISGLLSPKMYGPPVKPPQPKLGLSAAFGSGTDWETSAGEDKYRRALYTTWRRSNPYPSMATFDAPNREVCTVRRDRSNTPLQALVTLNDPVYMEAAQALARRLDAREPKEKLAQAFQLTLARNPTKAETTRLLELQTQTRARLATQPEKASALATKPLGPLPESTDVADAAAWTVVANVLLNLDEALMRR
jgi:hypothetical protein